MGISLFVFGIAIILCGAGLSIKRDNPLIMIGFLAIGSIVGGTGVNVMEGHKSVTQATIESCMEDALKVEKNGDIRLKSRLTNLLTDGKMTKNELGQYNDAVAAMNAELFSVKIDEFKFGVSK